MGIARCSFLWQTLQRMGSHRKRNSAARKANSPIASSPLPAKRRVVFSLSAPDARNVKVAGDFTGWEDAACEMTRQRNGSWEATIALPPGQHEYRFIVDGQWADDPKCEVRKPNPFGGENCTRVVD